MEKRIKTRVLWISDLVVPTGFSRVSHSIIEYLPKNKYNITGLGINYPGDPHPYNFPIYPAKIEGEIYGINRLERILGRTQPEIIFILNDIWIIDKYLYAINRIYAERLPTLRPPKIVIYFPVDAEPHFPDWYRNLNMVSKAVVYTEFGKRVATSASGTDAFEIVPHGIDSKIFYRAHEDRFDSKKELFSEFINKKMMGPDSIIILNANRNQPRKRLEITMEAFSIFCKDKPKDVFLYMHCGNIDARHIDVVKLSLRFGINDRLITTGNNVIGVQAVSVGKLNQIYNACDIGVNTSLGEGWSLPNMEHAITGAPQIVPDHSACGEIYKDCGVLVPTIHNLMIDGGAMTVGKLVDPVDVAKAMELLYTNKELYKDLSEKSIAKFSSPIHSWTEIANTWNAIFTEVLNS